MTSLGKITYNNIKKFLKYLNQTQIITCKELLTYCAYNKGRKFNPLTDTIKNQDIIFSIPKEISEDFEDVESIVIAMVDDEDDVKILKFYFEQIKFYRKYGTKFYNPIVEIKTDILDKEIITNRYEEGYKLIDLPENCYYGIIKADIIQYEENSILYHGSNRRLGVDEDEFDSSYNYKPYNLIGNWFTPDINATIGYTGRENVRIYEYKTNKKLKLLNLETEESIAYFIHHILFIKTFILDEKIYFLVNLSRGYCITDEITKVADVDGALVEKLRRDKKCEDNKTQLAKYDYSKFKNLKKDNRSPYGLYIVQKDYENQNNFLNENFISEFKSASQGDGDKILASELCNLLHSDNEDDYKIYGWKLAIGEVLHIMICDTQYINLVRGFGPKEDEFVYKDEEKFKTDKYFKKYIKYKNKYINLKKLL
jgi:hypothetical protein